jgi:hypothetical protein
MKRPDRQGGEAARARAEILRVARAIMFFPVARRSRAIERGVINKGAPTGGRGSLGSSGGTVIGREPITRLCSMLQCTNRQSLFSTS